MPNSLHRHIQRFDQHTALVVGDVMIDSYTWGDVHRISPEAPVPVVEVTHKEDRLGGAANVALNLKTLGATPIICAVIGDDAAGERYRALMEKRGFDPSALLSDAGRQTTVKNRIIAQGQHLMRVDEEDTSYLGPDLEQAFLGHVLTQLDQHQPSVVILEDYNKGLLSEVVIRGIISACNARNIPTAVDPKKQHFFAFEGCTLFKPNLKELREGLGVEVDASSVESITAAVEQLEARMKNHHSLITLSEYGVYTKRDGEVARIPAHRREIVDVSGAGDTVIAVAALCLAQDLEHKQLAALANLAGGLVCEKVGVVPIEQLQLLDAVAEL